VIVKDYRVIATGYNGPASGDLNCDEVGCAKDELGIASGARPDLCRAVHSELNSILQCAKTGVSCKDATMYTNFVPCYGCGRAIVNSGIIEVVYSGEYTDNRSIQLFERAGIVLRKFVPSFSNMQLPLRTRLDDDKLGGLKCASGINLVRVNCGDDNNTTDKHGCKDCTGECK